MTLRGSGFCPGHITGFFSIHDESEEVLARGSRGAGVNLSLGAMATVDLEHSECSGLEMDLEIVGVNEFNSSERIYDLVLRSILPDPGAGWKVRLRVDLQLPVGQGFGMSGAGAFSTAIAVWEAFHSMIPVRDRRLMFRTQVERYLSMTAGQYADREAGEIDYFDCIRAAHMADLLTGGGLGDVVAQARGGIEMRLAPGIPPYGEVHTVGLDGRPSVVFMVLGEPLDTSGIITSPFRKRTINRIGEASLEELMKDPTKGTFMIESRSFASGIDLQDTALKEALAEVEDVTEASQIMLGNSVFAVVSGSDKNEKMKQLKRTWKRRGEVLSCDVDLMGARPVN